MAREYGSHGNNPQLRSAPYAGIDLDIDKAQQE
jgi:hypothetical protein